MTNITKTLLLSLVAAVLLIAPAQSRDQQDLPPSITVSGEGKVLARPDMAEIQIGVVTDARTAVASTKANNEAMSGLMKALRDKGVPEKDMITSNFNLNPQYHYDNSSQGVSKKPTIVGFQTNNDVHVKVRNLSTLGDVLDSVIENGANRVNSISFSLAEPAPILDEARRKAMEDAHRKAQLLATSSGAKITRVLYITESGAAYVPRPMMAMGGMRGRTAVSYDETPIATGEQAITSSVNVVYGIE